MPLHLLGKKSWNVYNTANIEKVKADEAKAAAREEAEEQRMQEADSERRLQILRGTYVEPPPADEAKGEDVKRDHREGAGRERKRRRIAGENDTDREMRYTREDRALLPARGEMQMTSKKSSSTPLMDSQGHINLFPIEGRGHKDTKNAEVEAEKAKRKKEFEDQYTMRFSNAAGFKQAIDAKPWYEDTAAKRDSRSAMELPSKDVWGNEDPRRKEREELRTLADDPLAAMRHGAARVRETEKQRAKWREDKVREIKELEDDERRREKRRKRHREGEAGELDHHAKHGSRRHHRHDRDESQAIKYSYQRRSRSREHESHRQMEPYTHRRH